jgi:hypothetical protein
LVSTIASLIKSKKDPAAHAHAGRVTAAPKKNSGSKGEGKAPEKQ